MNERQADQVIELLQDILVELRDVRSNFDEFTGYNTTKMSDAVSEIGDRISGGFGGIGGKDLGDVTHAIEMLDLTVQSR